MTDINDVKAGEYQLIADRWDERTSKPGEPFTFTRHRKGDVVTLDEADAKRLFAAGAVVEPGALEKAEAEAALQLAFAALQQLPDDLRQQLTATVLGEETTSAGDNAEELELLRQQLADAQTQLQAATLQQEGADSGGEHSTPSELGALDLVTPPPSEEAVRPAQAAAKDVWVAYAKAIGADPAWAEDADTTKAELIAFEP